MSELLTIERPGFIETLFPEEKAALPSLWALLETTNAPPAVVAVPPLVGLSEVDISTPAGAPMPPAKLLIATLPAKLVAAANRLELTRDDDVDPTTVTVADLNAAITTPGPYTPAEVADFEAIKRLFLDRAGTSLRARVRVTDPSKSAATIATWGAATLRFEQEIAYTETRSSSNPSIAVALSSRLSQGAVISLPANDQLVIIDETTEAERVFASGVVESVAGSATVDPHPSAGYVASFAYEAVSKAAPPGVDASVLSRLATPGFGVAPGRYQINVASRQAPPRRGRPADRRLLFHQVHIRQARTARSPEDRTCRRTDADHRAEHRRGRGVARQRSPQTPGHPRREHRSRRVDHDAHDDGRSSYPDMAGRPQVVGRRDARGARVSLLRLPCRGEVDLK